MAILVEGCSRAWELKEMIKVFDGDVMDSACQIHDLNVTKSDLLTGMSQFLASYCITARATLFLGAPIHSRNILEDPELKNAVKAY
ncbi:hypothetical protein Tco_1347942, partial [Tanacetum coccineum]